MNTRVLILGFGATFCLGSCCSDILDRYRWDINPGEDASAVVSASSAASSIPPSSGSATVAPAPFHETSAVAWRADNQAVVIAQGNRAAVLPVDTSPPIWLSAGPEQIAALAFSPKGDTIAAVGDKGAVWLYNATTGALTEQLKRPDADPNPVTSGSYVAFSSDGSWIGATSDRVRWWEVSSKRHLCSADSNFVFELVFAKDGKTLLGTGGGSFRRWDLESCRELDNQMAETGGTFGSALSPDGAWMAAAEGDGHGLTVFTTQPFRRKGKNYAQSKSCDDHVYPARFSRNGEVLLVTGAGHWFRSFRVGTFNVMGKWTAPPKKIPEAIYPFDDGTHLVARWEDGTAKLVDTKPPQQEIALEIQGGLSFAGSPDSSWFIGITEKAAILFETTTGKRKRVLETGDIRR